MSRGGILVDGNEVRHTAALGEGAAHEMTGALGGDHDHVNVCRGHDLLEVDVETVGEHEGIASLQMRGNLVLVHIGLHFVGQKDHDEVSLLAGFGNAHGLKAVLLGELVVGAAGALTNNNVHTGIAEIESVSMTLAAVTKDGNRFVLELSEIGIAVIIDFHWSVPSKKEKCSMPFP